MLDMRLPIAMRVMIGLELVLLSCRVQAGWFGGGTIVFDPSNFAKNAVTAQESIQSTLEQVQAYLLQARQYQSQLAELEQLPSTVSSSLLQKMDVQVQELAGYQDALTGLYGTVGNAGELASQRYREAALSGLTPAGYARQQERATRSDTQGALPAFQAELDTMSQMDGEYQQVKAYQRQIPLVQGMTASMEVMNSQLNMMILQNADLRKLLALQGMGRNNADLTRQAHSAEEEQRASQMEQLGTKQRQLSEEQAQQMLQVRDRLDAPWPVAN
ncbi:MAG: hypothetical protein KGL58_03145 [Pseudomonadota bacterium]|nr:hypothetical protein [Pseudomonadota bacterium]